MSRAAGAMAFWDPTGERYGIPTYPWGQAPDGYATVRQLAATMLRPGGQAPAAQIMWRTKGGRVRVAFLYRVDQAAPKRVATPAQLAALEKANAAKRLCPDCGQDRGYILPQHLGICLPCADRLEIAV